MTYAEVRNIGKSLAKFRGSASRRYVFPHPDLRCSVDGLAIIGYRDEPVESVGINRARRKKAGAGERVRSFP
jgi:hypothetical protein